MTKKKRSRIFKPNNILKGLLEEMILLKAPKEIADVVVTQVKHHEDFLEMSVVLVYSDGTEKKDKIRLEVKDEL